MVLGWEQGDSDSTPKPMPPKTSLFYLVWDCMTIWMNSVSVCVRCEFKDRLSKKKKINCLTCVRSTAMIDWKTQKKDDGRNYVKLYEMDSKMIVYVKWIAVIFLIFLIYIYIAKVPKKQNMMKTWAIWPKCWFIHSCQFSYRLTDLVTVSHCAIRLHVAQIHVFQVDNIATCSVPP